MIKCWLKSLGLTILSLVIAGFVSIGTKDITIMILFTYIIVSAILTEVLSILFLVKTKAKKSKKIICGLLLPSNYYLLYVLYMIYVSLYLLS